MLRIASQDRLPRIVVAPYHVVCFGEIEYRIGCHNAQRVSPGEGVDYPNLAVKVILLARP